MRCSATFIANFDNEFFPKRGEFFPVFPALFAKDEKTAGNNWEKLTGFWEKLGKTQNSSEWLKPLYL